jgi:MYND finger
MAASDGTGEVPYEPAHGSWVVELEEAKEGLARALDRQSRGDGDGAYEDVLEGYLRVCRAYRVLRRWERLQVVSKKALKVCQAAVAAASRFAARRHAPAFREHRQRARDEISVETNLRELGVSPLCDPCAAMRRTVTANGGSPDMILGPSDYANVNMFHDAALRGDAQLMEVLVALGVAIDFSFEEFQGVVTDNIDGTRVPSEATVLLVICATLAIADSSNDPTCAYAKLFLPPKTTEELDRMGECAMQLVRLGADPTRKLHAIGSECSMGFQVRSLEGKSAFQIAAMTKRRPLVALMWEHMQLSQEGRAEIVHCRCGSRLPWKMCHSTGPGQPSHYALVSTRTCYRLSPLARCPCHDTAKTYYECCWKDNRTPLYVKDEDGSHFSQYASAPIAPSLLQTLASAVNDGPSQAAAACKHAQENRFRASIRLFREAPSQFQELCLAAGPKSNMPTWDAAVYAGCLERLETPFFWKDVHWDLDQSELLRQAGEWNAALLRYLDDEGVEGDERERVVAKHAANPCGPCGYSGCDAFETQVREFERCATCKAISYCRRRCQVLDWDEHESQCCAPSVRFHEAAFRVAESTQPPDSQRRRKVIYV